jgi:hypothetical protein
MTRKPKGKRKPTSTAGKDASPRGGLKTKQTRVHNESEMSSPGPQQTKLSFAPTTSTRNTVETPTPTTKRRSNNDVTAAITPEPGKVARLPGKDEISIDSSTNTTDKPHNDKTKEKTKQNKKITYLEATKHSNDDDKQASDDDKPAAKPSKKKAPKTKTVPLQEIRYRGIIDTPPSDKPFDEFKVLLKKFLTTVQSLLGKGVWLGPWDAEQEATFPHLKLPSDVPESRESIGIYLGNYINPKQDGSKIYMNLRWIVVTDRFGPLVPPERFGMELADALPKLKMSMQKQPNPCQSVKSGCIGWFMYSSKHINSKTFLIETKAALGIPQEVAIGISYRTITNEYGKKPPFNRDDPPAAAIHLDIDERYYMIFQPKASSLWRKNSKKRLPNGVQLRLVPCFSSPIGKSMTDDIRADAKTLAERQYFFVKEHLRTMEYHFISLLDTPVSSDTNAMTLRRAMMARAPKDRPTSRLIHNIDQSWNQPSKYIVTTVVGREEEANRFLTNLIPEMLHTHGPSASKWFSSQGLTVYKDVRWNPEKGTTSSTNSKASAAMVEEDLWDLGPKWKSLAEKTTPKERPDATQLDKPTTTKAKTQIQANPAAASPIQERLAGDKSVASFRNTFGRDLDSDDGREDAKVAAEEAAKPIEDLTGTQFLFSKEQLHRENERALNDSESDGKSMSTAGKTTGSTRLALKEAQEELAELKLAALEQKAELQMALAAVEEKAMHDQMEEAPPPPPGLEDSSMETAPAPIRTSRAADIMDTDEEPSDIQLLRAAMNGPRQERLEQDPDAMEEDQHQVVHLGTYPGLPPLPPSSSSSSSSSSATSGTSKDTQELAEKLRNNPFNALRKHTPTKLPTDHTPTKILTKNDRPSGSKSDSASHQSSGQESGSSADHLPEASGPAGAVIDDAGPGD